MALFVEGLVKGPQSSLCWDCSRLPLTSALMAPIGESYRYGRKPTMLRASIAMTWREDFAFVPPSFWLLPYVIGVFSGFVPTARLSFASQVPKNQSGYASRNLIDGTAAGTLMGPLVGRIDCRAIWYAECLSPRWFFLSFSSLSWLGGALRRLPTNIQGGALSSWELLTSSSIRTFYWVSDQYDHSDDRSVHSPILPLGKSLARATMLFLVCWSYQR